MAPRPEPPATRSTYVLIGLLLIGFLFGAFLWFMVWYVRTYR